MKKLTLMQKVFLTIIEGTSVFLTVFLNQMIITVFPAYESVKLNDSSIRIINSTLNSNCTIEDPSNSYVTILIGSKYCTELVMFPIIGLIADRYHPPLILFGGLLVETLACAVYSITGNFYWTIVARVIDGLGNTLVSTSGLTILYMIYVKDKSRSRVITIDSILVYISGCISPYVAGSIYESFFKNERIARLSTFMLVGPLFLICSIMIIPFSFENSKLFSGWFIHQIEENTQTQQSRELIKITDIDDSEEHPSFKEEEKIQSPLSLLVLLRDKHIMLIVVALTFNSLVINSLEATLPIFMIRKFCSDQKEQGSVWLFGVMSLTGFVVSTFLFHLKPHICWILPLAGLFVNGVLCVSLYFCTKWWMIGFVLGLIFFHSCMTEVIVIPLIPKLIDRRYPHSSYGSGSSLTLVTYTISGILGTFPVGPLVDRFGFLTLCIVLSTFIVCLSPSMLFVRSYFKS